MSKQEMRDEAERLVKEAMERKILTIKQGNTRIEAAAANAARRTASPPRRARPAST